MGESSAVIPPLFFFLKKKSRRTKQSSPVCWIRATWKPHSQARNFFFKFCNCWVVLWLCALAFVPYDLYSLPQTIYTALVSGLKPALLSYRGIKKLWKSILPSGLKRWLNLIGNPFAVLCTLQDSHGTMQSSLGEEKLGLGKYLGPSTHTLLPFWFCP